MHFIKKLQLSFLGICLVTVNYSNAQHITANEAKADIAFLQEALINGHPGWDASLAEAKVVFDSLSNTIPDSISLREFYKKVRYGVTTINCVHTYTKQLNNPLPELQLSYFPFNIAVAENKLFLLSSINEDTFNISYPQEITTINGRKVEDILDVLWHFRSTDGNLKTTNNSYIKDYGYYFLASIFDYPSTYTITLVNSTNPLIVTCSKNRIEQPVVMPEKLFSMENSSFYKSSNDSSVFILDIDGFANDKYKRYYAGVFEYIEQNKIENLVIDLRDNLGGNRYNVAELLGYFLDPTQSYTMVKKNGAAKQYAEKGIIFLQFLRFNIAEFYRCKYENGYASFTYNIKPKATQYTGNLFVLINGKSASASGITAGYLDYYTDAILIGEEAAGGINGNNGGSYANLKLPNSSIIIQYPVFRIRHDYAIADAPGGVLPNYTIVYSNEELMQSIDKEMEKVYELTHSVE